MHHWAFYCTYVLSCTVEGRYSQKMIAAARFSARSSETRSFCPPSFSFHWFSIWHWLGMKQVLSLEWKLPLVSRWTLLWHLSHQRFPQYRLSNLKYYMSTWTFASDPDLPWQQLKCTWISHSGPLPWETSSSYSPQCPSDLYCRRRSIYQQYRPATKAMFHPLASHTWFWSLPRLVRLLAWFFYR